MSFPRLVARYIAPFGSPKGLSYTKLLALHVAAYYKLRSGIGGWVADIPEPPRRHASSTIKPLVRRDWLEGNSWGVKEAMGDETYPHGMAKLWISGKGKTLLKEITIESGWVFDEANYEVIRNRAEYRSIQAKGDEEMDVEKDIIELGTFDDGEAAAYDQAAILLHGEDAQTYLPHGVVAANLSDEVIRQIDCFKGSGKTGCIGVRTKPAGLIFKAWRPRTSYSGMLFTLFLTAFQRMPYPHCGRQNETACSIERILMTPMLILRVQHFPEGGRVEGQL